MIGPILVWNIRGIGTSKGHLKKLLAKVKSKMVVFSEPFQNFDNAQRFMRFLHFDNVITNEEEGGNI